MLGEPEGLIRQLGVEDEHTETVDAMQEVKRRGDHRPTKRFPAADRSSPSLSGRARPPLGNAMGT